MKDNLEYPDHTLIVNNRHPQANNSGQGKADKPFLTIQAATLAAMPGDTILVHEGVYRELISPERGGEKGYPITFKAIEGAKVEVKGSNVFSNCWVKKGSVWFGAFDLAVFSDFNPYALPYIDSGETYQNWMGSAYHTLSRGQVFLDGNPLHEVSGRDVLEQRSETWMPMEGGTGLLVHFPDNVTDPLLHLVEYTVRKAVFRPAGRGLGYITLEGFHFEHAANPNLAGFWDYKCDAQLGLVSTRSGHHFIIRNNTIRYAKSIGLDIGSEGRIPNHYPGSGLSEGQPHPGEVGWHLIEGNTISDNGQGGLCGMGHIGTVIRRNVFERNNTLGSLVWEEAAIKTHFFLDGVIEDNLFRDNYCIGIWLDNVYQNIRISRNVILSCHGAGIFCEMGPGPCLIDNNIVALSLPGNTNIGGNGIYAHDAFNVTITNNLLIQNSRYGLYARISERRNVFVYPKGMTCFYTGPEKTVPCDCSDFTIVGNIFAENFKGEINLPYPGPMSAGNLCDWNMFCTNGDVALFAVNDTSGVDPMELRNVVNAVLPRETAMSEMMYVSETPVVINLSAAPTHGESQDIRPDHYISMQRWQAIMGFDLHSTLGKLGNSHWQVIQSGQGQWIAFTLEGGHIGLGIPSVEGLKKDLCGDAIPDVERMPGPFQLIKTKGKYRYQLWPPV